MIYNCMARRSLQEEILEAFLIALDEAKLKARVYPGQGASISGDPKKAGKRKKTVPLSKLITFEPEEKMQTPEGRAKVDNIKKAIKSGKKLPPIVVRKTKKGKQILDGHHRYQAHKELGTKKVQVARLGKRDVSTSPTPYKED